MMAYARRCLIPFALLPLPAWAAGAHDPVASVVFWLGLLLLIAITGRYVATKRHQPRVLGELFAGMLLGNVGYFAWTRGFLPGFDVIALLREGSALFTLTQDVFSGLSVPQAVSQFIADPVDAAHFAAHLQTPAGMETLKVGYVLDIFSRFGVIFLLFMVGLDTSLSELRRTGRQACQVAIIGVLAPVLLWLLVSYVWFSTTPFYTDLFVAATLSATSIGITARVLVDLKQWQSAEARTILGAAVIDDVLGLILLAIVSSLVVKGSLSMIGLSIVVMSAIGFFLSALLLGPACVQLMVRSVSFLQGWEARLLVSFLFVMLLSWLASLCGLAALIGAFTAGMILNEQFFSQSDQAGSISKLMAPFEFILAPLFFMLIGIQVKWEFFLDKDVLALSLGLLVVAVLGKCLSGLGARRQDDRWLIGLGMLPRGEVGLVFASTGHSLGVMSDKLFSAVVLVVMMTTFLGPIGLKWRIQRRAT